MKTKNINGTAKTNHLNATRRLQRKSGVKKTGKVLPAKTPATRRGGPRPAPGREKDMVSSTSATYEHGYNKKPIFVFFLTREAPGSCHSQSRHVRVPHVRQKQEGSNSKQQRGAERAVVCPRIKITPANSQRRRCRPRTGRWS
jgi:hypothetical protein